MKGLFFSAVLLVSNSLAQDKWVWNGKSARAISSSGGRLRYGVYEEQDEANEPYRPGSFRPVPPHRPDLPPLVRPHPPIGSRPPPPPYSPKVPDDNDPTSFEKCKCVHSFNCKSPGLLFGSCDTGKKYCCEKNPNGGGRTDYVPDSDYPEVLAGPGGPVDHIRKPPLGGHRPTRPSGGQGLGSYAEPTGGSFGLREDGSLGLKPRY